MEQLFLNGILVGLLISLISLSVYPVICLVRFFHFAHAVVIAAGAYFSFLLSRCFGWPMGIAIPLAILLSAGLGCLMEVAVYKPLRKREAKPIVFILASLGLYTVLQNVISLVFGDDTKSIRTGPVREGLNFLGARITPIQIITIVTAIVVVVGLLLFMKYTRLGKAMRTVANDANLARVVGIDSDRVIMWAFAIGSGLAGLAGILMALDTDMTPTMGMRPFMMGIVAMIIGGKDSIIGIVLGALLLAFAQQYGAYYLGSEWQDAIAFAILLIFLLFRPQGFLGKKV
ncbi:MAG: branched-chain amino acid ABC transporter permease [Kiritimatiellae bacterium]|jgi:branched-chain amino acid transport system permease protein|nr:branched-chain amino acid ABC transporter permease [Kiritimatiellia bacterium]